MENKQPIPTYLKWVISGLIIWGILMTFLTVNKNDQSEAYRLDNERVKRDSQKAIERFTQEIENERKARKAIEARNFALEKLSQKSDKDTQSLRKQLQHEKNKNYSRFSDVGYDSLISGIYPD